MKQLSLAILSLFIYLHLQAKTSSFSCLNLTESIVFIDTIRSPISIQLYPNPSSNWLFIKHPMVTKKQSQIVITNLSGNPIQKISAKLKSQQTIINISHLPTGMYLVIWMNGVETATARLSKE